MASLATWRAEARRMDGPHGPIAWWSGGEGPPALLIHGFPTASYDWARVWERLGARRRLIALDMLGFGLSAKPARHRYRMSEQADLQERLCAELGVESVDVIAHDYGVSVAEELAARQLEGAGRLRLRSIVYLNGGLIPGEHRPRPIQHLLASPIGSVIARLLTKERFARAFAGVFGPDTRPDAAELDDFWALLSENGGHRLGHKLIAYMAERVANKDRWVGALTANVAPQRFVCGALDPVSGVHVADAYERLVPEADVVVLDTVGHYPQWESPEETCDAVEAFWARLPGGG
ncbi:MAG: alpha/beta hydrolase [Caulobacterales bacterium]|nr:alpha/beta hydrolase [Caulobacterales bacterium]